MAKVIILIKINYFILILFKRHWLYGEKIVTDSLDEKNRVIFKGWFPSSCVTLHEDDRVKYSRDKEQGETDDKKEK
jgi:hypothetical protein